MAYINVDEVYILDNTGLQVDMATDIPFADAGFSDDQKAQARANIGAGGSNVSLLDNPFFTVNQRGVTSVTTNGYGLDRWYMYGANGTMSVSGHAITMASGALLLQRLESNLKAELNGKTITVSVLYNDGSVSSGTATYSSSPASNTKIANGDVEAWVLTDGNIRFAATTSIVIQAVKLELGSVSTLANDTPPDYGTELAKCQRYFIRFAPTAYTTLWSGVCINASTFAFNITTPVPMRYANPTISFTGTLDFVEQTTSGASLRSVTGLSAYAPVSNSNNIRVLATTASTLGSNNLACIYTYAYTPVIDVSCDL